MYMFHMHMLFAYIYDPFLCISLSPVLGVTDSMDVYVYAWIRHHLNERVRGITAAQFRDSGRILIHAHTHMWPADVGTPNWQSDGGTCSLYGTGDSRCCETALNDSANRFSWTAKFEVFEPVFGTGGHYLQVSPPPQAEWCFPLLRRHWASEPPRLDRLSCDTRLSSF